MDCKNLVQHVSDVLNYEKDIKGKRLVLLRAGVGAGKNFWAKSLADLGLRILVITSRAATADAQCAKYGADRRIELNRLVDETAWDDLTSVIGDNRQTYVVCTNAHIERFVTQRYKADDPQTHIWNKFDLIILDEAHSLAADATFTESPFYTARFLKKACLENPSLDIVLMSGTMEMIMDFKKDVELPNPVQIDLFEKCTHVEPKEVLLHRKNLAMHMIRDIWKQGKRCIYFSNTIADISKKMEALVKLGIPESDIGVTFSNEKRSDIFSEDMLMKRERIDYRLANEESVPDDVRILFATSRCKEGISINDEDISEIFCESHQRSDLIQMVGRVRHEVDKLHIISDAKQLGSESSYLGEKLDEECLDKVRETIQILRSEYAQMGSTFNIEDAAKNINKKFPCIMYDPLTEDFQLYEGRIQGERKRRAELNIISRLVKNPDEPVTICGRDFFDVDLMQEWFPYSQHYIFGTSDAPLRIKASCELGRYFLNNNLLNVTIDRKTRELVEEETRKVVHKYSGAGVELKESFKSLRPVLNKLGYEIEETGTHDSDHFVITKLGEK